VGPPKTVQDDPVTLAVSVATPDVTVIAVSDVSALQDKQKSSRARRQKKREAIIQKGIVEG